MAQRSAFQRFGIITDTLRLEKTVHRTICGIWLALAFAGSASTQVRDLGSLRLRKPHELKMGADQTHRFLLTVQSGYFIHVELVKKGVDVVLSVRDPEGREVVSSNSPNSAFGFEHASAIAEQTGDYAVQVTAKGAAEPRSRYRIELLAIRAPTEDDRLRLRAEALLRTAVKENSAEHLMEAAGLFDRLADPYFKALALHRAGSAYDGMGERQKALEFYNQALTIRHALHDRAGEGATLNNIGIVYAELGDKAKALEFYNRALPVRSTAGDRPGATATLRNIASIYSQSGEKLKAVEAYTKALPIYRAMGDRKGEADSLYYIGDNYRDQGEKRKALEPYTQALGFYRDSSDHESEAQTIGNIGAVYADLGETQKALESYNQALPIFRATGDRKGEAAMLFGSAQVYFGQGERQKALDLYSQALAINRDVGDQAKEAQTLNRIGVVYSALGDQTKALETYNLALAIFQVKDDRTGEAGTLANIGNVYSVLAQKQRALEFYNRALPMHRAVGDRKGEANSLNNIGTVYRDLGEPAKALEQFQQALAIWRALGERADEAKTLGNMGISYSDLGEMQKALEFYNQALPIKRAVGDRIGEANTLNSLGSAYFALGENQKALEFYNQAVSIYRATGERSREAKALGNIGSVYSTLGEPAKALDFFNRALTIDRAAGDPATEAYALRNLGGAYYGLGELQKALDFYNQALPIFRSTGDRAMEAGTLDDIGIVYSALGEKQKALEFYNQALPIFRSGGERASEAATLGNIGNVYSALGDKQKALEFYNQALPIFRTASDKKGEANALTNIGVLYHDLGDKQKALEFYNQALPIERAAGDRTVEAGTLNDIGVVYDDLGQTQQAAELYNQALAALRSVGDRRGEAVTLGNLCALFSQTQPDLAIWLGKQAVNVLQTIRRDNKGLDVSLRHSYEKSIEYYYRNLAGLLVRQQRFPEAEEVLSLLKDKEARDFVRRDSVADQLRSAVLIDAEKSALARYDQIVGQVVAIGQRKAALVAKQRNESLSASERAQTDQLDLDLAAANRVLERFFQELGKSFAATPGATARIREFRDARSIQALLSVLGPDVVAIYTLVLPEKYVAMLVTSGARKAYTTVIQEADLNSKIFEFRQRLQHPTSDPLPLAQELYRILFPEGLREDLESMQAKTIMWSVDSTLRYIPISALHDGRDYLVKRFRNSLITPASIPSLTDVPKVRWQGVGFGVSEAHAPFDALPSVPAELRRIFRQQDTETAPIPGTVRLNGAFTLEAFQNDLRQPNKSVVHIATHFDSRPGEAADSQLLLGDGNKWGLDAIDAAPRLFDGVDLLTLSACNTAFSNHSEDGREVDSFGSIAHGQGAKAVIASLWSVSDEATAQLMQTMYSLRQQNPAMGKNEALRQAQDQMASGTLRPAVPSDDPNRGVEKKGPTTAVDKEHDWSHPYYWAPFILIGNWK